MDLIVSQRGRCKFSEVPLRFDVGSGTPVKDSTGCHPLYASLDHIAAGADHCGHQIVSYALNDLKGHLPTACFEDLVKTPAWISLMDEWRKQADEDPEDFEGFYAILNGQKLNKAK